MKLNSQGSIFQTGYVSVWVHGAFAGYGGITVGICSIHYVYFPIPEVITYPNPKVVDPNSHMWHHCLTSTGQPDFI
ncbi:ATP-dependent 6-phosphofructokinase 5, chloroplastic [Ancistrocladus abbreviatus]